MATASFAQKLDFVDSTNQWTVYTYACGGDPNYVERFDYSYGHTRTVNDTDYLEILNNRALVGYVRSDKSNSKVYFKAASPTYYYPDTVYSEQLLYDFNLQIGDTFSALRTRHHVSAIDTVTIRGTMHKVWHMEADSSWYPYMRTIPYDVVEGLGSLMGPLNPMMCFFFENCIQLTCFSSDHTSPSINPGVGYRGYFNNTTSCNLTFGLSTAIVEKAATTGIYPNPATTELHISSPEIVTQVQICDPSGRVVYSAQNNSTTIEIAGFQAGLYFVTVNNTDRYKFVKQ
jgi:hypothetical protein